MNVKEMFDLSGKVAIVSGGGKGIGLKMAEGLAEAGANVVLCSRKIENCQRAAEKLSKLGVKALALKCDVKFLKDIQEVVDKTLKEFVNIPIFI
jgi:NAD(P)-dependent dehydrogenase (short-subunit alcohol dehydrogenase family)